VLPVVAAGAVVGLGRAADLPMTTRVRSRGPRSTWSVSSAEKPASKGGSSWFSSLVKFWPCVSQVAFASGAQEMHARRVPASTSRQAKSRLCP
jgi:hypothetical protein